MGGGKTAATLKALDLLSLTEDVYPALVIAPLRVAESTWPDEVAEWDDFKHLSITPIVGDEKGRKAAMRLDSLIYSVNFENIEWLLNQHGDNWPYKTVVVDEASKL